MPFGGWMCGIGDSQVDSRALEEMEIPRIGRLRASCSGLNARQDESGSTARGRD